MGEVLAHLRVRPEALRREGTGGDAGVIDAEHHLPVRGEAIARDVDGHVGLGRGGALEYGHAVDLETQRDRLHDVAAVETPGEALAVLDEHTADHIGIVCNS